MMLPSARDLQQHLGLNYNDNVEGLIHQALLKPLHTFLAVPGKNFRAQLVNLGWLFGQEALHNHDSKSVDFNETEKQNAHPWDHARHTLCKLLEMLHAGSLIIDDIEDNSLMRRNQPTFHRTHGLAVALNAGNWLYFWPIHKLGHLGLSAEIELRLVKAFQHTLLSAHVGQALDVGVAVDKLNQKEIKDAALASMELKTGALMGLALESGAILQGAPEPLCATLRATGRSLGVALQMFDDLGNLRMKNVDSGKHLEDFLLRRLSWVWASAAEKYEQREFEALIAAVKLLPDENPLQDWLLSNDFLTCSSASANDFLKAFLKRSQSAFSVHGVFSRSLAELQTLGERISQSYGS